MTINDFSTSFNAFQTFFKAYNAFFEPKRIVFDKNALSLHCQTSPNLRCSH